MRHPLLGFAVVALVQLAAMQAAAQSGGSLYGTAPSRPSAPQAVQPAQVASAEQTAEERSEARKFSSGLGLSISGGLLLVGGVGTMIGFTVFLASRGYGWGELDNPDGTQGGNTLGAVIGLGVAVLGAALMIPGIVMAASARRARRTAEGASGPTFAVDAGGLTLAF